MCNLSEGIYERGYKIGLVEGYLECVLDREYIMKVLDIPEDEFDGIIKYILIRSLKKA